MAAATTVKLKISAAKAVEIRKTNSLFSITIFLDPYHITNYLMALARLLQAGAPASCASRMSLVVGQTTVSFSIESTSSVMCPVPHAIDQVDNKVDDKNPGKVKVLDELGCDTSVATAIGTRIISHFYSTGCSRRNYCSQGLEFGPRLGRTRRTLQRAVARVVRQTLSLGHQRTVLGGATLSVARVVRVVVLFIFVLVVDLLRFDRLAVDREENEHHQRQAEGHGGHQGGAHREAEPLEPDAAHRRADHFAQRVHARPHARHDAVGGQVVRAAARHCSVQHCLVRWQKGERGGHSQDGQRHQRHPQ
jgi:hypothetical protein